MNDTIESVDVSGDVNLPEKSFAATIDALLVNTGLTIFAMIPSMLAAIFTPWRLAPLLGGEHPDGRKGLILGPGIYFVLTTITLLGIASLVSGSLDTAELAASGDADNIMHKVRLAIAEGDVQKATMAILPVYLIGLGFGAIGSIVLRLAGPLWTPRLAIGAGLYSWASILLVAAIAVILSVSLDYFEFAEAESIGFILMLSLPVLIVPWQHFWFLRVRIGKSILVSIGLSVLLVTALLAALVAVIMVMPI